MTRFEEINKKVWEEYEKTHKKSSAILNFENIRYEHFQDNGNYGNGTFYDKAGNKLAYLNWQGTNCCIYIYTMDDATFEDFIPLYMELVSKSVSYPYYHTEDADTGDISIDTDGIREMSMDDIYRTVRYMAATEELREVMDEEDEFGDFNDYEM